VPGVMKSNKKQFGRYSNRFQFKSVSIQKISWKRDDGTITATNPEAKKLKIF
jgi:hypothetical protein